MAQAKIPYVGAYGRIPVVFEKIQQAATPDRFTYDYLADTLAMKGGSARQLIPFLKRIGFLGSDGVPTDRYKRFRNKSGAGAAAAAALLEGFAPLFDINESAHKLSKGGLKGLIVQITGAEEDSSRVTQILGSFNALLAVADLDAQLSDEKTLPVIGEEEAEEQEPLGGGPVEHLRIGYTINLNLPATSDIAVFNAIFKSLRENLLR